MKRLLLSVVLVGLAYLAGIPARAQVTPEDDADTNRWLHELSLGYKDRRLTELTAAPIAPAPIAPSARDPRLFPLLVGAMVATLLLIVGTVAGCGSRDARTIGALLKIIFLPTLAICLVALIALWS